MRLTLSLFYFMAYCIKKYFECESVENTELDFFYLEKEKLLCFEMNQDSIYTRIFLNLNDCKHLINDLNDIINEIEGGSHE